MAKKPISDSTFTAETPTILRYLETQHYRSPDWSSAVVKDKDRGLGIVEADDGAADSVQQIDQIPNTDGRKKER